MHKSFPLYAYQYDTGGFHGEPVIIGDERGLRQWLYTEGLRAVDEGREVRIVDEEDYCVFHGVQGDIIFPPEAVPITSIQDAVPLFLIYLNNKLYSNFPTLAQAERLADALAEQSSGPVIIEIAGREGKAKYSYRIIRKNKLYDRKIDHT